MKVYKLDYGASSTAPSSHFNLAASLIRCSMLLFMYTVLLLVACCSLMNPAFLDDWKGLVSIHPCLDSCLRYNFEGVGLGGYREDKNGDTVFSAGHQMTGT
ncbi:hypothetical protein Ancab_030979 [Ancistrocladus abbreviatus]